jgi:aryl-alcohol dehydrogenase-like predicted oxidoreductase
VLGRALRSHRDQAVIATKFGYTHDADQQALTGTNATPAYIRRACQESLRRLGASWIDLYQLHLGELPPSQVDDVLATLEQLVTDGLIRCYGWSTEDPRRAASFATGGHCAARDTGMPIAQMRRYAELARDGQATLMERLLLLTEHDARVQDQITLLQARREHLQDKIDWYRSQLNPQ